MISPVSPLSPSRLETTLPVAMEYAVRCADGVETVISGIMNAMEHHPYGASDGFAVQISVSEALNNILSHLAARKSSHAAHVRTSVTSQFVRVEVELDQEPLIWDRPHLEHGASRRSLNTAAIRSYMTAVEVRSQGHQLVLYRARGQGSALARVPTGYDFQI